MPIIRTNLVLELPNKCPKCGKELEYINALDSEAKLFSIYCKDVKKCKYCAEIHIRIDKGFKEEVNANCL